MLSRETRDYRQACETDIKASDSTATAAPCARVVPAPVSAPNVTARPLLLDPAGAFAMLPSRTAKQVMEDVPVDKLLLLL
jgi:hypothetical protein